MITNKDLSIDSKNGQVILNGDKYDLGTQGEIDAAVKDIYSVMGQNGAKNLIPYPYYEKTHTENGVNFTDNGDGSITVDTDGSASTGNANFYCQAPTVISNLIKLDKNKTYIFSDTTHSGIVNNCVVGIRYFAEGVVPSTATGTAKSCNASINWQVTVTNAVYAFVYVYVWSGKTISNITFKPMLRLAEDTDNTYQPYAKTNRQLTEVIGDLSQTGITGSDVAEQLESLNEDIVLESFTPTLAAAIGTPNTFDHNCFYNPKTKEVHIQVMIYSADALIPTNNTTIFTVDQKYRPNSDLQIGMAMLISSDNWDTRAVQMERCVMGANGNFSLNNFVYGPKPTKIVFIEADYIAA